MSCTFFYAVRLSHFILQSANYKKGPMLLLHAFKAIYDKDNRYKLFIAGQFQDPRDVLYFKQMIKEWKLEKNVIYEGWQTNINKWLDDKNYLISTSILEGHPVGIMEAMAMGIKPLIHNFAGAKSIYPAKYIWNTIDECVNLLIAKNYDSKEYHDYIENNYSLEKQVIKISKVIKGVLTAPLIVDSNNKKS